MNDKNVEIIRDRKEQLSEIDIDFNKVKEEHGALSI